MEQMGMSKKKKQIVIEKNEEEKEEEKISTSDFVKINSQIKRRNISILASDVSIAPSRKEKRFSSVQPSR